MCLWEPNISSSLSLLSVHIRVQTYRSTQHIPWVEEWISSTDLSTTACFFLGGHLSCASTLLRFWGCATRIIFSLHFHFYKQGNNGNTLTLSLHENKGHKRIESLIFLFRQSAQENGHKVEVEGTFCADDLNMVIDDRWALPQWHGTCTWTGTPVCVDL